MISSTFILHAASEEHSYLNKFKQNEWLYVRVSEASTLFIPVDQKGLEKT